MKKTKLMALVMVVALMLMGVGYAAWTETFETDVSFETGNMEITLLDLYDNNTEGSEATIFVLNKDGDEGGIKVDDKKTTKCTDEEDNFYGMSVENVNVSGNKLTADFRNMVPGSVAFVGLRMKNNSSIPVCLEGIDFSGFAVAEELKDYLDISLEIIRENSANNKTIRSNNIEDIKNFDFSCVFDPNEEDILARLIFRFSGEADEDTMNLIGDNASSLGLTFNFIQANLEDMGYFEE